MIVGVSCGTSRALQGLTDVDNGSISAACKGVDGMWLVARCLGSMF